MNGISIRLILVANLKITHTVRGDYRRDLNFDSFSIVNIDLLDRSEALKSSPNTVSAIQEWSG